MAQQQAYWVRNNGPDRTYMHHGLSRLPGKVVLMAPGFLVHVLNNRILWPSGAIICVDRFVYTTSPALGKQTWNEEVSQADFVAALRESVTVPPAIEPEATETPAPAIEPEATETESLIEAEPKPKRRPGRPRKAS